MSTKKRVVAALCTGSLWLLVAAMMLIGPQTARAHENPAGCQGNAVGDTILLFRDTDGDGVGDANLGAGDIILAGETVYLVYRLQPVAGACSYSGGTITLTTPNGPTNLPGPTACVGGVVDATECTTVTALFQTAQLAYTANCAQEVSGLLNFSAALVGAASHTGTPNDTASDSKTLNRGCDRCASQIDKQVSCDGGATWHDTNAAAQTQGCVAPLGANVQVQWFARNTGDAAVSCTLTDSNNLITVPGGGAVAIGAGNGTATNIGPVTNACSLQFGQNEPNTSTLASCTCPIGSTGRTVPAQSSSDTAQIECCGVEIDKQVTCANPITPTPLTEFTFVVGNEDGTGRCTTTFGQNVTFARFVRNRGSVPLSGCVLTDINAAGNLIPPSSAFGRDVGGSGQVGDLQTLLCSQQLDTDEQNGNTASVNCLCSANGLNTDAVTSGVSAFDVAGVDCQANPSFTLTKECLRDTPTTGQHTAIVHLDNTGDVPLTCTVTDTIFLGEADCTPPFGTPGQPINPALSPAGPYNLAAGAGVDPQSVLTGLAAPGACNKVEASCVIQGTQTPAPPVPAAFAHCPVGEGCFTRTPGYWGTHPQVAQQVLTRLGGTLNSCGLGLNNTTAANLSTTQDICSHANDLKTTAPLKMQLIRQCAAAGLNLAASRLANLNCGDEVPNIINTYDQCCNVLCPSGNATSGNFTLGGCVGALDAFNNFDAATGDTFTAAGLTNSSAQPQTCQIANGDKFVNTGAGRSYGPAK